MKIKQDTIEFKFVGEGFKRSFNSIDEALEYVEKKKLIPANGDSWEIEEIHHKVISHSFESKRKPINDVEITKRIIEYFLEHANIDNVKFESYWSNDNLCLELNKFKDSLRKYNISEYVKWLYNTGDYKPCNNYLLKLPGLRYDIMFRDGDIVLVQGAVYYGRHVHHRLSKAIDVDEKLYKYCIKNLK